MSENIEKLAKTSKNLAKSSKNFEKIRKILIMHSSRQCALAVEIQNANNNTEASIDTEQALQAAVGEMVH